MPHVHARGQTAHLSRLRLPGRNSDCYGIGCVVLAAGPERFDEFRWNEASDMTAGGKPAPPVVRGAAGLHCDTAPGQLLSPPHERFTSQHASLQYGTGSIKHADRVG